MWQKYTEAVCHLGNMKIALLEQQFSVISPFFSCISNTFDVILSHIKKSDAATNLFPM